MNYQDTINATTTATAGITTSLAGAFLMDAAISIAIGILTATAVHYWLKYVIKVKKK